MDRLPRCVPEEKGGTEMAQKRRRFSAGFKKKVALEALREADTVQAIAARHTVHPTQVGTWKRQAVEGLDEVFEAGVRRDGEHEKTIRELHAKNRVKELKLDLFSARCSTGLFDANALRLMMSTFAMVLVNRLRGALAAAGSRLGRAYPGTIRQRLLKVGARVRISARRVHVALSSAFPERELYAAAWRSLLHA